MKDQHKYITSLLLPLCLMAVSLFKSPYLFKIEKVNLELQVLPHTPVLLYVSGNTHIYYTSEDLLHPEDFGAPGEYYNSVLFDIWPTNEGHLLTGRLLTWVKQINRAISLKDAYGNSLPSVVAKDIDEQLSRDFLITFNGKSQMERGTAMIFKLPNSSSYRLRTSIEAFVALAIKDPKDTLLTTLRGSKQLANKSFKEALRRINENGINRIGIPFMPIVDKLGDPTPPQDQSWQSLLDIVQEQLVKGETRSITFGGYGILPNSRKRTDTAFRQTWSEWKSKLNSDRFVLVHEEIRLTVVVTIVAIISSIIRRKKFRWLRLISIVVVASGLVVSIAKVLGWLQPLLPPGTPTSFFLLKTVFAVFMGIFMERVSAFNPEDEIS